MKFRKEYQTYLLIVIAIIIAGYFLKHFFFNKKKKVIEGQGVIATTYYRIDFSSIGSIDTTPTNQDLLKELILTQYDTVLTDDAGIKYVQPGDKYKDLIPLIPDTETDTLLMKDSTGEIIGLKVVPLCDNRLEYFKQQAAAAADTADAAAAAAAYDYARLILSNTYKDNLNIMALIAAANLFTIMGQPNITDYTEAVVTTAKNAAKAVGDIANVTMTVDTYARQVALYAAEAAKKAAQAAADAKNTFYGDTVDSEASTAVKYAAQAAAWITKVTFDETTILLNVNYQKVITKADKAAFTTAAGLIYLSIYEIIDKI